MSTATDTLTVPHVIQHNLERLLDYAKVLVADIPAERFCEMPHPTMNHPAFAIGHLSIYPDRLFPMLGQPDLAAPRDGYAELFAAGCECANDASKYPTKDEVVGYFFDRHEALRDTLATVDPALLAADLPMEGRMKEMFPKVGLAVAFLSGSHIAMHLGQVSAWRRAIGMGSAM